MVIIREELEEGEMMSLLSVLVPPCVESMCWTRKSLRSHMVLTFYPGFITMDAKHKALLVRVRSNWNFYAFLAGMYNDSGN